MANETLARTTAEATPAIATTPTPEVVVSAGWLSPAGVLHPCSWCAHDEAAERLYKHEYADEYRRLRAAGLVGYAAARLSERGWRRISSDGEVTDAHWNKYGLKLTQAQLDAVMDMATAARAKGRASFAGNLMDSLKRQNEAA